MLNQSNPANKQLLEPNPPANVISHMPPSRPVLTLLCALILPATAFTQTPTPAKVSVIIVGTFHMSNPGHDMHNVTVDDVLLPKSQAELARITDAFAHFHPTVVMAEWPAAQTTERYTQYLAGTLPPSRNEVVQLGFRLAKTVGLTHVYGIDADGDFPYGPVETFAKSHGQTQIIDRLNAEEEANVQTLNNILKSSGIPATLRYLNDPTHINNSFYRQTLRIGEGTQQPGADLLTAWYHRNFLICSNILQNSHPGDRIVIFYGSGHAFLLRQCIAETPGFTLVEPNTYLPR